MISADELAEFYRKIGATLWHLQYLEDVLTTFLTSKIVHERRCAGRKVAVSNAQALLVQKRRMTLGPLIKSCSNRKIIRPEHHQRFESFKIERHWLVHRCMVEIGDDLYVESTRDAVFTRVTAIQEESISLKKLVVDDFNAWMAAHGLDLGAAQKRAEEAVRKLKGA
jgi:prolyl oligopeptidase PreP (S9A serine peptidase family)